ncbi:MAG TPA: magnesium transporter [Pseudomonadales bacterium]|nr:magnesium transporter [Pseudomonadales bacterium]
MKRHYYVTNDWDDLEAAGIEMEQHGIQASHLRVLTEDIASAKEHHLKPVNELQRRDLLHAALIGASFGLLLAASLLALASTYGWAAQIGWTPFILLSVVLFVFSTWEGGLIGIQMPSPMMLRFLGVIKKGRHVLLVDVAPTQEKTLAEVVAMHPSLHAAREGTPDAQTLAHLEHKWHLS